MTDKLILVIDYEESVREVLKNCLRYLGGWEVLSVASLQEGLDALQTRKPDAIVLDIPNRRTHDLAFINAFKTAAIGRSIPILLISASAKWFSPQQLKEWGVVGAIAKPFNAVTLSSQVAKMLGWSLGQLCED